MSKILNQVPLQSVKSEDYNKKSIWREIYLEGLLDCSLIN